ncbi:amidohydrolase [Tenacibaculum aquimarinum]|uniref:amidohydrolase n=1 Tax=Tenacibaculum aquimarinum TaxID=2910675 RepID=UPI001F0AD08B|nr:amidohydrolase [Tenacibaculum aquimarinum]MCH3884859.1 amidohydrolase [Tenacibaculum aquimarinum]
MSKSRILLGIIAIAFISYFLITKDFDKNSDTLYINGNIITLNEKLKNAEAIFIENGKIKDIGTTKELEKYKKENIVVDLKGATVLPGFIDSHSHVALSAFFNNMIDLSGFKHKTNAEVWSYLKEQIKTKQEGEWVICKGIDPILVEDLKTPNISFLDEISPNNPILLVSQSMHTYWVNSNTFKKVNITKETPNPSKASYYEKDENGNLTGLIAEQEAFLPILNQLKKDVLTSKFLINSTVSTLNKYAKNGNTTVVSAGITINDNKPLLLYRHLSSEKTGFLNQTLATFGLLPKRTQNPRHFLYIRHDRSFLLPKTKAEDDFYNIIGVKHWYDGSPYTGSMYLESPYLTTEFNKNKLHIPEGSSGKALIEDDSLVNFIKKYDKKGWQIAIHSQGDLSSKNVINAFKKANSEVNITEKRHRIEHCLLLSKNSLSEMKALNMTPSFHTNHLFYYGKALSEEIIGKERAEKLLPIHTADSLNLKYSMHADQPMFESKPFHLIQTAVKRQTKENDTLGYNERISLLNGLKSMTINAAWQINMEDKIGSLAKGKYADFIIIDKNPFEISIDSLHQINILKTFINGNQVK